MELLKARAKAIEGGGGGGMERGERLHTNDSSSEAWPPDSLRKPRDPN